MNIKNNSPYSSIIEDYLHTPSLNGSRNKSLFVAAAAAKDAGYFKHELQEIINKAQSDGLGIREINQTIDSAYARPVSEYTPQTNTIGQNLSWNDTFHDLNKPIKKKAPSLKDFFEVTFEEGENIFIGDSVSKGKSFSYQEALNLDQEYIAKSRPDGMFIAINPLKGTQRRKSEIAAFRHLLIESDEQSRTEQIEIIKRSKIPYTAMVWSGSKSVHLWVPINASSEQEYTEKALKVYEAIEKEGLKIDKGVKDPSRLCRLPFAFRNDQEQELLELNKQTDTIENWFKWLESPKMPELNFFKVPKELRDFPEEKPTLIKGVLREGGIGLLGASSKAGKTFALLGLSNALVNGAEWMGHECTKASVLHIDLELDYETILERIKAIPSIDHTKLDDLDFLCLGDVARIDTLALIEYAIKQKQPKVCVIDPIYMALDDLEENSNSDMRQWFTRLRRIATENNTSIMMASHFGKGSQEGKASMDKIVGAGVFSRAPDAVLTLTEIANEEDAYTLEYTLRHFKRPPNKRILFRDLTHVYDGDISNQTKNDSREPSNKNIDSVFNKIQIDGSCSLFELMDCLGVSQTKATESLELLKELELLGYEVNGASVTRSL